MARTLSTMVPLGTTAAPLRLTDTVSGKIFSLEELTQEKAFVLMFICNHCPFVKHVNDELVKLAIDYLSKGIAFIAISSNDVSTHPEDSPELMKVTAQQEGYPFPYLYDDTQEIAKAYDAACTPDFFIFDASKILVYRGQLDNSRPGNGIPVTGNDLRLALDQMLKGLQVQQEQHPSIGCNIKWKNT